MVGTMTAGIDANQGRIAVERIADREPALDQLPGELLASFWRESTPNNNKTASTYDRDHRLHTYSYWDNAQQAAIKNTPVLPTFS